MKASDIKVGDEYAYSYGRYYTVHKCQILEKDLSDPWGGGSGYRKGYVKARIFYDNRGPSEEIVPTRRIRESWSKYVEDHKEELEAKAKAKRQAEHDQKVLEDRVEEICKQFTWDSPLPEALRLSAKRGYTTVSISISDMEEILTNLRSGFKPVPKGGRLCNRCEQRPAMVDSYLCETCYYGIDDSD